MTGVASKYCVILAKGRDACQVKARQGDYYSDFSFAIARIVADLDRYGAP
jgi:hypothetical protein